MEAFGKIINFALYSDPQLERMKSDLSLLAPLSFLKHCANFYRTHAKRDPYIEELKLLDRFTAEMQKTLAPLAPAELYTNDKAVAKTYKDMMQRRTELRPDSNLPISLWELATLATDSLLRTGKHLPLLKQSPFTESAEPNKDFQIRFLPLCKKPALQSDLFALLIPSEAEESSCEALLARHDFTSRIKSLRKISFGGILFALLQESDGFGIALERLLSPEEPISLLRLTDSYRGAYLIRAAREHEKELFDIAGATNTRVVFFATAEKGHFMMLRNRQTALFQMDTAFLHTLIPLRPFSAKLKNEADGRLCIPARAAAAESRNLSALPFADGFCCASATSNPENAFFTNAFYTALLAVLDQVLSGCDYTDQMLSVCLGTPALPDPQINSNCLSCLIGLYRLQAELGLPSSQPLLISDPQSSAYALSVFAYGEGVPLPTQLQSSESSVWLFSLPAEENALPNFDALRKMLQELSRLRKNGRLLSAYAVCNRPPLHALQALTAKDLDCSYDPAVLDSLSTSVISIVAESTEEPKNACFVGNVFEKSHAE